MIVGLDHVQLAMPFGGEDKARDFYAGLLGIPEVPKPPHLAKRGGCWFENGAIKVHLGVEVDFRPACKAHPAFRVADLFDLAKRLAEAGFSVAEDEPLAGFGRLVLARQYPSVERQHAWIGDRFRADGGRTRPDRCHSERQYTCHRDHRDQHVRAILAPAPAR